MAGDLRPLYESAASLKIPRELESNPPLFPGAGALAFVDDIAITQPSNTTLYMPTIVKVTRGTAVPPGNDQGPQFGLREGENSYYSSLGSCR